MKNILKTVLNDIFIARTEINDLKTAMNDLVLSKDKQIKEHVELIQKLIHENPNFTPDRAESTQKWLPPPLPNKEGVTSSGVKYNLKKDIIIKEYNEDKYKITGNTFARNELIKQISGRSFDSDEPKGWLIPKEGLVELENIFNENNVSFFKDF